MKVEYSLGWEDWVAFYINYEEKKNKEIFCRLWVRVVGWGIVTLLALGFFAVIFVCTYHVILFAEPALAGGPWPFVIAVMVNILAFLVTVALNPWFRKNFKPAPHEKARIKAERQLQKQVELGSVKLGGKYQLHMDQAGFEGKDQFFDSRAAVQITESVEYKASWGAVSTLAATENHLFVGLNEWSYLIIPKHAFPSDREFQEFVEAARRFRAAPTLAAEIPVQADKNKKC